MQIIWLILIIALSVYFWHEHKVEDDRYKQWLRQYKDRGWTFGEFCQWDNCKSQLEKDRLEALLDKKYGDEAQNSDR